MINPVQSSYLQSVAAFIEPRGTWQDPGVNAYAAVDKRFTHCAKTAQAWVNWPGVRICVVNHDGTEVHAQVPLHVDSGRGGRGILAGDASN